MAVDCEYQVRKGAPVSQLTVTRAGKSSKICGIFQRASTRPLVVNNGAAEPGSLNSEMG